jgi:hypothetical protein
MIFPNWTGWKTVKLILSAIGAGAAGIATANLSPAVTQIATVVGTVDGTLLTLVVIASGTNAGPAMAVQRKP